LLVAAFFFARAGFAAARFAVLRFAPVELRFTAREAAARDFFLAAIPSTSQGIVRPTPSSNDLP
jgi:hypothetical protein